MEQTRHPPWARTMWFPVRSMKKLRMPLPLVEPGEGSERAASDDFLNQPRARIFLGLCPFLPADWPPAVDVSRALPCLAIQLSLTLSGSSLTESRCRMGRMMASPPQAVSSQTVAHPPIDGQRILLVGKLGGMSKREAQQLLRCTAAWLWSTWTRP